MAPATETSEGAAAEEIETKATTTTETLRAAGSGLNVDTDEAVVAAFEKLATLVSSSRHGGADSGGDDDDDEADDGGDKATDVDTQVNGGGHDPSSETTCWPGRGCVVYSIRRRRALPADVRSPPHRIAGESDHEGLFDGSTVPGEMRMSRRGAQGGGEVRVATVRSAAALRRFLADCRARSESRDGAIRGSAAPVPR